MEEDNYNQNYEDEQRGYDRDRSRSPRPAPRDNGVSRARSASPADNDTDHDRERERERDRDRDRDRDDRDSRDDANNQPPEEDEEEARNTGSNLFVTGINPRLGEEDLARLFEKYGEVEKCNIMRDPHTRESRGFGFVNMANSQQADAAKEALQGEVIEGRTFSIEKARRSRPRTPTPGKYFGPPKRGDFRRPPRGGRFSDRYEDRRGGYGRRDDPYSYRGGSRYGDRDRFDDRSYHRRDRDDYAPRIDRYASRDDRYGGSRESRRGGGGGGGGGGGDYYERDSGRGGAATYSDAPARDYGSGSRSYEERSGGDDRYGRR